MKLYQYQMPLPRRRMNLVLVSNGTVALVPQQRMRVCEYLDDTHLAVFDEHGFAFIGEDNIDDETFAWGTMYNYRNYPLFKRWLQAQELSNPFQENHAT